MGTHRLDVTSITQTFFQFSRSCTPISKNVVAADVQSTVLSLQRISGFLWVINLFTLRHSKLSSHCNGNYILTVFLLLFFFRRKQEPGVGNVQKQLLLITASYSTKPLTTTVYKLWIPRSWPRKSWEDYCQRLEMLSYDLRPLKAYVLLLHYLYGVRYFDSGWYVLVYL